MKKTRIKKGSSKKKTAVMLMMRLFLSATALASDIAPPSEADLQTIVQMRMKQESEENNVVRMIQQPLAISGQGCSTSEQSRQRLRDVGRKEGFAGSVSVNAGHGDVKIDGNSGQINNSVNVQINAPNDRKCF